MSVLRVESHQILSAMETLVLWQIIILPEQHLLTPSCSLGAKYLFLMLGKYELLLLALPKVFSALQLPFSKDCLVVLEQRYKPSVFKFSLSLMFALFFKSDKGFECQKAFVSFNISLSADVRKRQYLQMLLQLFLTYSYCLSLSHLVSSWRL